MKVFPFYEVAANAESKIKQGWTIFQQFNCAGCGVKQTMPNANGFHKFGTCEECGHLTNIEKDGCNFMATMETNSPAETLEKFINDTK